MDRSTQKMKNLDDMRSETVPAKEAPVENILAKEAPVENILAKEAPVENILAKEAPVETVPANTSKDKKTIFSITKDSNVTEVTVSNGILNAMSKFVNGGE